MARSECACAASRHWRRPEPASLTSDLPGRKAPGLPPQILALRHTGRTDLKRRRNRTNRLAGVSPRQCAFANVFRIGSRHPCWPPFPSMELESEILPTGNPDSGKKQHALATQIASNIAGGETVSATRA